MTEDGKRIAGTGTSAASTNRTCGSGTEATGSTSGMPGGWGGGGSSEGCGTSTPRRCTHIRTPTFPQWWRHRYRRRRPPRSTGTTAHVRGRTTPMSRAVRKDGCRWSRRQRRPGREAEGGSRGGETPLARDGWGIPPNRRLPRMSARHEIVKYDGRRHRSVRETSRNQGNPGRTDQWPTRSSSLTRTS